MLIWRGVAGWISALFDAPHVRQEKRPLPFDWTRIRKIEPLLQGIDVNGFGDAPDDEDDEIVVTVNDLPSYEDLTAPPSNSR